MDERIDYAGVECSLRQVFDEEQDPFWGMKAQAMIDGARRLKLQACCIHEGNLHGYYEEVVK